MEFFSVAIVVRVCKYLNCKADPDSLMMSEASLRARDAFISPLAVRTLARASQAASASAAMVRCNCNGNLTSLLKTRNRMSLIDRGKCHGAILLWIRNLSSYYLWFQYFK